MFALLFSFASIIGNVQSSDSLIITSEIKQVTVFQNQAQIQRSSEISISKGTRTLIFEGISANLIDESVQLKGSGAFTLLSLNVKNKFSETTIWRKDIQQLRDRRELLNDELINKQSELDVIGKEIQMLDATRSIVTENKLSSVELDELLTLYRTQLSDAFNRKNSITKETQRLRQEITLLDRQINESGQIERTLTKSVIAEIQSDSDLEMDITIDYLVHGAGWEPTYDLRADGIDDPLQITYKANIYQNTGVDWEDVKFVINSGDPSSNAMKPELDPTYVGYYIYPNNTIRLRGASSINTSAITNTINRKGVVTGRVFDAETGETLPGANLVIENLSKRGSTNIDGNFEINNVPNGSHVLTVHFVGYSSSSIPIAIMNNGINAQIPLRADIVGLEEVVVTGVGRRLASVSRGVKLEDNFEREDDSYQLPTNTIITNQTSFSYEIEIPYTVPSDGKTYTLEIKREFSDTEYNYGAVPKLSANAYLEAKLPDWADLKLIAGDANIYFENRFVGSSFIDPVSVEDTLAVSLGKDEQIVVEREKLSDFSSKNFFRNRTRDYNTFEIRVRNTKSEKISVTIEDQIPISTNEEIRVSIKELSDGSLDQETGIVRWDLDLQPGETITLRLEYEIEYPKGRRIVF